MDVVINKASIEVCVTKEFPALCGDDPVAACPARDGTEDKTYEP